MAEGVKREEIYRKIQVPKEEVRAYYDEHKNEFQRMERVFLRELFISAQDKSPEEIVPRKRRPRTLPLVRNAARPFPPWSRTIPRMS